MRDNERLHWFRKVKDLSQEIVDLEHSIEALQNHYWKDSYTIECITEKDHYNHQQTVIKQGQNICAGEAKKRRLIAEREELYNKPGLFTWLEKNQHGTNNN